ncbi:MAG: SpoIIE family protein phosphatase [Chloroflexi bacterium]|nr:SpoIIE family protein phosphatase [Chloroflexota bacterium]
MQIQIAVAKVGKYATRESGDSLEMVERPMGGVSLVLVDGQRSGRSAKAISNLVAGKVIALLAQGVRDGGAARAAHDYLYMHKKGKVSATLNIISVDLETKSLVLSRNTHCPTILQYGPDYQSILDEATPALGTRRRVKPTINEIPITLGLTAVVFTDGILSAGQRSGTPLNPAEMINNLYSACAQEDEFAQAIADQLLAEALRLDDNRPTDDVSVLVVSVVDRKSKDVRRMSVTVPVPPLLRP